jgi:tRNA threonylcarbamoyladenosine biosynthesis protein TsaE
VVVKTVISRSAEETEKVAAQFARNLKKGDVVALSGPLGSGKTTFIKGLAKGLGVKDFIKSPTFNLLHIHQGRVPLYHFDFYRLDESDLEDLGFVDYVYDSDGVAVLEWAERVKGELPPNTRWVVLSPAAKENERRIEFLSFPPALPAGRRRRESLQ